MSSSRWIALVVLVVLAATLLVLGGCPTQPKTEGPAVTPPKPPGPATAAGKFVWTEKPAVADIPAGEITGMLNGKPFTAKLVRIEYANDEMKLVMSDMKLDKPSGMVSGDTGAELSFKLPEGVSPGTRTKALKDPEDAKSGKAWYYYPQGKGPMSMNTPWSHALQMTDWRMAKDPKDPRILGSVKGKVAICFEDEKKSWVAGTFEGIVMQ